MRMSVGRPAPYFSGTPLARRVAYFEEHRVGDRPGVGDLAVGVHPQDSDQAAGDCW